MLKKIIPVLFVLLLGSLTFCEEERLDTAYGTSITCAKFVNKGGFFSTGSGWVSITENAPVFVEINFPAEWTVNRIFIIANKTTVNSSLNGTKEVATMYNFMIKKKTKYGEFNELRRFTNNTVNKLEIKENIKTSGLRIQLLPYDTGKNYAFGEMALEIWGYKGEAPKKEKIKISTKEDAKKALKLNEISPKEYMELLKKLSE